MRHQQKNLLHVKGGTPINITTINYQN